MRSFLSKCLVFLVLFISIILVAGYDYGMAVSSEKSDYMGAILLKHNRLKSIVGRKLIFAGGSNLSLGINSRRVQDSLKIPVVNLGLNAGLGVEFFLNELKANIHSEDIVVLSIEYFISNECSFDILQNTLKYLPEAALYTKIPDRTYLDVLKSAIEKKIENLEYNKNYVTGLFKKEGMVPLPYMLKHFNELGDCEGHLDLPAEQFLKDGGPIPYRYWSAIDLLNEFYRFAKTKGVQVYFMYPIYTKTDYVINQETFQLLNKNLRNNLLFPVIGQPKDFVFDDKYFFDTVYHPRREGRELRTTKVIELLKKYLSQ